MNSTLTFEEQVKQIDPRRLNYLQGSTMVEFEIFTRENPKATYELGVLLQKMAILQAVESGGFRA